MTHYLEGFYGLQTLTASDDMFRDPVMTEPITQQFIHKVVIRLEVLRNCCVIRLLQSLKHCVNNRSIDYDSNKHVKKVEASYIYQKGFSPQSYDQHDGGEGLQ